MVSRAAFGKKYKDQEQFMKVIKKVFELASGFSVADMYPSIKLLQKATGLRPKLEKLHGIADRILGNIIKEHRNKNGNEMEEDTVDVLLKLQEHADLEFPISDKIIKTVILVISIFFFHCIFLFPEVKLKSVSISRICSVQEAIHHQQLWNGRFLKC